MVVSAAMVKAMCSQAAAGEELIRTFLKAAIDVRRG